MSYPYGLWSRATPHDYKSHKRRAVGNRAVPGRAGSSRRTPAPAERRPALVQVLKAVLASRHARVGKITASMQPHCLARPPVQRRLFGLGRRYLGPTLAVLLLVLFWTVAVPAFNESLEAGGLAPGTILAVGQGEAVSFAVDEGWLPPAPPFPNSPEVSIFKDGILFVVKAGAFDGPATVRRLSPLEQSFDECARARPAVIDRPLGRGSAGFKRARLAGGPGER
jgi:hypothetical protein